MKLKQCDRTAGSRSQEGLYNGFKGSQLSLPEATTFESTPELNKTNNKGKADASPWWIMKQGDKRSAECICIYMIVTSSYTALFCYKLKGPSIPSIQGIRFKQGELGNEMWWWHLYTGKGVLCVDTAVTWDWSNVSPFVPGVLCPHHPSSRASIFPAFWRNSSYWMETKEKRETKVNHDDDST